MLPLYWAVFGKHLPRAPAGIRGGLSVAATYLGILYGAVPASLPLIALFILPYRLDRSR